MWRWGLVLVLGEIAETPTRTGTRPPIRHDPAPCPYYLPPRQGGTLRMPFRFVVMAFPQAPVELDACRGINRLQGIG